MVNGQIWKNCAPVVCLTRSRALHDGLFHLATTDLLYSQAQRIQCHVISVQVRGPSQGYHLDQGQSDGKTKVLHAVIRAQFFVWKRGLVCSPNLQRAQATKLNLPIADKVLSTRLASRRSACDQNRSWNDPCLIHATTKYRTSVLEHIR